MSRNGSGTYSLPAGNPVVSGTTITTTWANTTLSDIATALTNSIAKDGQTTPTSNLPMGNFKHTSVAVAAALTDYARADQVQNSSLQYLTSVSGVDTITAVASITPIAYVAGQTFRFIAAGANTGAATLNVSSLGAKAITKNGTTALAAGDIAIGSLVNVTYDGTQFQLVTPTKAYASSGANFDITALNALLTINGSPVPLVNRAINPKFAIDQDHSGAAQTITAGAALAYTVDQWYAYCTGANVTGQRVTGTGQNQYAYQFTGATSVTGIGFGTRIERLYTYDLNNGDVSFSVKMANSLLNTVTWTAYYANTADTFGTLASPTRTQIATGTFTVNGALAQYGATFAVPAAAITGIEIVFTVGAQTSGTWRIEDFAFVKGSVIPSGSEIRLNELQLCQRYYERLGVVALTTVVANYQPAFWKVSKRTTPALTIALSAGSGAVFSTNLYDPESGVFQSNPNSSDANCEIIGNARL